MSGGNSGVEGRKSPSRAPTGVGPEVIKDKLPSHPTLIVITTVYTITPLLAINFVKFSPQLNFFGVVVI